MRSFEQRLLAHDWSIPSDDKTETGTRGRINTAVIISNTDDPDMTGFLHILTDGFPGL